MKFQSHFNTAVNNLAIGKLRTLLALLGILVGTFAVVVLVSAGELAAETALKQFRGLGINLMSLNFTTQQSSSSKTPALELAQQLKDSLESVPGIANASPYFISSAPANFEGKTSNPIVIGSEENIQTILNLHLKFGRFFSKLDKNQLYCVLGTNLIKPTLPGQTLTGKQIKVGSLLFTVIGGLEPLPESSFFHVDINNSVVIPLSTMPFLAQPELSDIILKLNPNVDLDQVKSKITRYFSEKLPKYQVNIQTARELLKSMSAQQNIFTLLLGAVGSISLFVGGIGIMNVMLAAIAERKEEIGLRLAIGAQPKDIRRMFLTEAALLACIGGGAGVLLGVIGTYIISVIADWDFVFLVMPPVLGFSVTVLICIFFGFYPAYKASKLDPIVALRNE